VKRAIEKNRDQIQTYQAEAYGGAIIVKIIRGQPLTSAERRYAAYALMKSWLPKHVARRLKRIGRLAIIEEELKAVRHVRDPQIRRLPADMKLDVIASEEGFRSAGALKKWLFRARRERKRR